MGAPSSEPPSGCPLRLALLNDYDGNTAVPPNRQGSKRKKRAATSMTSAAVSTASQNLRQQIPQGRPASGTFSRCCCTTYDMPWATWPACSAPQSSCVIRTLPPLAPPATSFNHSTHARPVPHHRRIRPGIRYPNCLFLRAPGSTVQSHGGTQSILPGMPPPKPRTPSTAKHKGVSCEVCADILGSSTAMQSHVVHIILVHTYAGKVSRHNFVSSRRACGRGYGRRLFRRGE